MIFKTWFQIISDRTANELWQRCELLSWIWGFKVKFSRYAWKKLKILSWYLKLVQWKSCLAFMRFIQVLWKSVLPFVPLSSGRLELMIDQDWEIQVIIKAQIKIWIWNARAAATRLELHYGSFTLIATTHGQIDGLSKHKWLETLDNQVKSGDILNPFNFFHKPSLSN